MRSQSRSSLRGPILGAVAAAIIYQVLASITGLNSWLSASRTATAMLHGFGVILFGVLGIAALCLRPPRDRYLRPFFYRLIGGSFLIFAVIHAMLMLGDPLKIFTE